MSASHAEKGALEAVPPSTALGRNGNAYAAPVSRIADPGTLGLFSFASTTLILSLFNAQARGVKEPNVVIGMAVFCGGLAQLLAGMWEFPRGNVFGATAFTSYGAFWMAYATILIPGSGTLAAYENDPEGLSSALGIFLITWAIVTFFLLIIALRKTIAFIALFFFLTLTFILLAAAQFSGVVNVAKAGGVMGVITAFIAYYIGVSSALAAEKYAIVSSLPTGVFNKVD